MADRFIPSLKACLLPMQLIACCPYSCTYRHVTNIVTNIVSVAESRESCLSRLSLRMRPYGSDRTVQLTSLGSGHAEDTCLNVRGMDASHGCCLIQVHCRTASSPRGLATAHMLHGTDDPLYIPVISDLFVVRSWFCACIAIAVTLC